jgi:hypothetical protein
MPLQKLLLKPGVNRENTRYTNEGGWYESDKVRFRQGTPEKIGGWQRISNNSFVGVCRSLWNWVTLAGKNFLGLGTEYKFYIESGGAYYDITPIRTETTLTDPFTTNTTTNSGGYTTVTVAASPGFSNGDYVTFYGGSAVGGVTVSGEYQLTFVSSTTYTIRVAGTASSSTTGGGTVYAVYQITTGSATYIPTEGWGAGAWNAGTWGNGGPVTLSATGLRIWNQMNWGQNLVYGPRGFPLYYWDANIGINNATVTMTIASPCVVTCNLGLLDGTPITLSTTGALPTGLLPGTTYYVKYLTTSTFNLAATSGGAAINTSGTQSGTQAISPRGMLLSQLPGADGYTPLYQNTFTISDVSRFLLVFGTNDYGSTTLDPMLIRWSDQESLTTWYPAITNQAGSVRLSHGSKIITTLQSRQEIVVWTDSSLYSLQYLGPPYVWGTQLLADNISIIGPNAAAMASGVSYWMGVDKFYKYDGRVQTLRCDLRQYIYENINLQQSDQVFASTNEGFNEVWFFYCSITGPNGTGTDANPNTVVDRYVVYNYLEDTWYYGNMQRTAWLDTGLRNYPLAATYSYNVVQHEYGVDDNETGTSLPITASITSSQYDIGDGHNFAFVYRMLPDLTFRGSASGNDPSGNPYPAPQVTMYLQGLNNSGSGITQSGNAAVINNGPAPSVINVDQYTGQIYIRVRGRQMQMQITSNTLGTQWQLGAPRIDLRPDGRR